LDYKTTGLLLLTNDGELARKMTLPSSGLKRVYIATLHPKKFGDIKSAARAKSLRNFLSPLNSDDTIFDAARNGATIGGIKYAPMEIEVLSRYPLSVKLTLTEGKKNEIRIVMDWLGFMVKKLHRISYGEYELGDLKPGEIRLLLPPGGAG
jgi:23S rRNA pseudouridine2605 synthase